MMLSAHRLAGTWAMVSRYIVLSHFARDRFIRAGFPQQKLSVKPNFVYPDPGFSPASGCRAVFVGRLTREKGVDTLLAAWRSIGDLLPLDIIGDGPLAGQVKEAVANIPGLRWCGWLPRTEVFRVLRSASVVIVPSLWDEPFGMIVAEAFAVGVPVLASAVGGLDTMIAPGKTGLLFKAGDERDLAAKARWVSEHPEQMAAMRLHARREFELTYTAAANYNQLLTIYKAVISGAGQSPTPRGATVRSTACLFEEPQIEAASSDAAPYGETTAQ
jgi:glycosyltransferase involved in cell wall biosynthesis